VKRFYISTTKTRRGYKPTWSKTYQDAMTQTMESNQREANRCNTALMEKARIIREGQNRGGGRGVEYIGSMSSSSYQTMENKDPGCMSDDRHIRSWFKENHKLAGR